MMRGVLSFGEEVKEQSKEQEDIGKDLVEIKILSSMIFSTFDLLVIQTIIYLFWF